MTKDKLRLFLFFLMTLGWKPAIAATFDINVPTNSGQVISRQIEAFDQRTLSAEQAYNYDIVGAKYNGIVPVETGTNIFFVEIAEGLSLFTVNEAPPDNIGQLRYNVITEGILLFRDDIIAVDNDPFQEILNEDGTTTFISTEGYRDISCPSQVCRTDGFVARLESSTVSVSWSYDLTYPLTNIDRINFWSANAEQNFSVGIGTDSDEFNPISGEFIANPVTVPESSSVFGLLCLCTVTIAVILRKY